MMKLIHELAFFFSFWLLILHSAIGFMAPQGMLMAGPRRALQRCNSPWTGTLTSAKGDGELDSAGLNKEMANLIDDIRAVQQDIKSVERTILRIEAAVDQGSTYMGISDPTLLFDERQQLRVEENQLRVKKNLLIVKENQLQALIIAEKQKPTVPVYSTEVMDEQLMAFHNSLTNATVTDDILQLPNGMSFLGDKKLGYKLFIRQCYRDLQKIIFDAAGTGTLDKIVVTGTPGIGKSVFNFYLLYLLRLQGKSVLFNSREVWYRFSDEGVERRNTKFDIKYFRDENGWFLCDPENKPSESFSGITVVTVSPEEERTKELLKSAKSKKFYMPPWSREEMEKCRKLQYPEVSKIEVEDNFDLIGGVARPIFNRDKIQNYLKDMRSQAFRIPYEKLRLIQYDYMSISDKLVHIFPVPESGYTESRFDFACEKAEDIITRIQNMKDLDEIC